MIKVKIIDDIKDYDSKDKELRFWGDFSEKYIMQMAASMALTYERFPEILDGLKVLSKVGCDGAEITLDGETFMAIKFRTPQKEIKHDSLKDYLIKQI